MHADLFRTDNGADCRHSTSEIPRVLVLEGEPSSVRPRACKYVVAGRVVFKSDGVDVRAVINHPSGVGNGTSVGVVRHPLWDGSSVLGDSMTHVSMHLGSPSLDSTECRDSEDDALPHLKVPSVPVKCAVEMLDCVLVRPPAMVCSVYAAVSVVLVVSDCGTEIVRFLQSLRTSRIPFGKHMRFQHVHPENRAVDGVIGRGLVDHPIKVSAVLHVHFLHPVFKGFSEFSRLLGNP